MIIRIVQVLFILHQRSTFFKTNYSQNLKILKRINDFCRQ